MYAVIKDKPIENYISLQEVPNPDLKAGWVSVKVDLTGICGSDLHTFLWTEDYQQRFKGLLPAIVGHEYTGIVQEVGAGVDDIAVGDRVVSRTPLTCGRCIPCLSGQESICVDRQLLGVHYSGAMAEFVNVPAVNCHKLPADYPVRLAALSEPISIAYGAVEKIGGTLGKNILVIGPGPIGYLTALLADMAGAAQIYVLGMPRDVERFALFKQYIPGVCVKTDFQDLKDTLQKELSAGGVDVAIEASGAPVGPQLALDLTAKQGLIIQAGISKDTVQLDMNAAVRNQITIKGTPAIPARLWSRLLDMLARQPKSRQEAFEAVISDIFPLSEALDAFQKAEKREGMKILLKP